MSQFNELLAQLKAAEDEQITLAKALPAEDGKDDETIQAAAAEGDDANPENPEDYDDDADDAEDEKPMAKSVMAMVDGEEVEAVDATDLIKSLMDRVDAHDDVMAKALASTLSTIKAQGDMIKSLQSQVSKLAGQGKGRKTVLSVVEKPASGETMAKSQQDGMTPADFMAKANAAFSAGKLTGKELTTLDVAVRNGQVSAFGDLIAKALS